MKRLAFASLVVGLVLGQLGRASANEPPTAVDDDVSMSTPAGHVITIYPLANDSDPDGDTLSIRGVRHALFGSISLTEDRQGVVYAVGPRVCGQIRDYFTYRAVDAQGAVSNQATVNVRIDQGLTCVTVPSSDVSFREGESIPKRGGVEVDWFGTCPLPEKCTGTRGVTFTIEDVTTSPNDYTARHHRFKCNDRHPAGFAHVFPVNDRRPEDTEALHVVLQNVIVADGGSNVITMHIRDND